MPFGLEARLLGPGQVAQGLERTLALPPGERGSGCDDGEAGEGDADREQAFVHPTAIGTSVRGLSPAVPARHRSSAAA